MAKIAVSSQSEGLDALVDARFGRANGFMVVDTESMEYSYLANSAAQNQAQGAGIAAAELVAKAGVQAVLTGHVGPKAFQALQAAGVEAYPDLEGKTVREAVELYRQGKLQKTQAPTRQGHWQ